MQIDTQHVRQYEIADGVFTKTTSVNDNKFKTTNDFVFLYTEFKFL